MLPTEVWLRILQHVKADKTELWTSIRHVSRAFKEGVETIFRERHLPQTFIHIDLGKVFQSRHSPCNVANTNRGSGDHYDDEDHYVKFNVEFKYSHLSPTDPNIAIFTIEGLAEQFRTELCKRLKHWQEGVISETPGHILQIRRDVNDTLLPNKDINYSDLTLSLPWREIYTAFYCEEAYYNHLTSNWAKDRERWALELHQKMLRGEINMEQMMLRTIKEFAKGSEVNRERARAKRIEKQYRKNELEYDWVKDGDEDQKREWRESVKRIRQVVDLCEFSDDEDDYKGEGESGEEEEEDDDNEEDSGDEEDEDREWEDAASDEDDARDEDEKNDTKKTVNREGVGHESLPIRVSCI